MADETLYTNSEITILLHGENNEEDELLDGFWPTQSAKKRRLSVEQVKSLEKNFELENKLEPDRKTHLARELGLQPRQVAIWFQNRRARFKTKQLEKHFAILKTSYENLKSEYEEVVGEKEKLKTEVENLKQKLAVADYSSENLNSAMADSDEDENLSGNLLPICFPKLESSYYYQDDELITEGCCNLIGFQIEDQPLGFWPY